MKRFPCFFPIWYASIPISSTIIIINKMSQLFIFFLYISTKNGIAIITAPAKTRIVPTRELVTSWPLEITFLRFRLFDQTEIKLPIKSIKNPSLDISCIFLLFYSLVKPKIPSTLVKKILGFTNKK